MNRATRLGLTSIVFVSCVAAVFLLTWFSSAADGPIVTVLGRIGTGVGSLEHDIRQRLAGESGRSGQLVWFDSYRKNANRLRRPDIVLLGAYDSATPATLAGVVELERSIGTTLPLVQIYNAWGDKPEQRFPVQLATAIWDMGSVPVITWEPWLTDFENARHPHLPLRNARERHGMSAVAQGDYDFYIDSWAADAARLGKPLFLRFAHEMNDPYRYPWGPQNNSKEEHIAAWRHVRDRFERAGAHNVIWTWSPHVAYPYWETYYPGSAYVDWVATGVLNFGDVGQQWSKWWSFDEIFGKKYQLLASFDKPIMIAEFASLAVGGDRIAWYRDALTGLPQKYPAVRAILFFHATNDRTVTYQALDWTIAGDDALIGAIRAAIQPLLSHHENNTRP